MTLDKYIQLATPLSLTARAAISLIITENYLHKIKLTHTTIDEFFNHLWQHPLKQNPQEFSHWEAQRGDLVDFGLTDDLPDDLEGLLEPAGITWEELFSVIEAPVEILWGNFFKTPSHETSLNHLKTSLLLAEKSGIIFPHIQHFQHSLFSDNHGWGNPITETTRDQWRNQAR